MLLPIKSGTPRCSIFLDLNNEVLYFLNASIKATKFSRKLLSGHLRTALWENSPTKKMFKALWLQLKPLSEVQRKGIYQEVRRKQFLQQYCEDTGYQLPTIPVSVSESLGKLCKYLFEHSSKLAGVRDACGETLHESFSNFRAHNKNICCFCGTSELAQVRAGADENEQWRAANDHLLSKDDYPIFAVHPDNLVPLCETCNSKAKLAKDLLNKKRKGHPAVRRRSFFPFIDNCLGYVGVELKHGALGIEAVFTFSPSPPEITEKLDTWNEVYQIQSRVEGKFEDIESVVDSDCPASDLNDFRQKVHGKATSCHRYFRLEGWNFWKCRLYQWLDASGGPLVDELWDSILDSRSDDDAAEVYGI